MLFACLVVWEFDWFGLRESEKKRACYKGFHFMGIWWIEEQGKRRNNSEKVWSGWVGNICVFSALSSSVELAIDMIRPVAKREGDVCVWGVGFGVLFWVCVRAWESVQVFSVSEENEREGTESSFMRGVLLRERERKREISPWIDKAVSYLLCQHSTKIKLSSGQRHCYYTPSLFSNLQFFVLFCFPFLFGFCVLCDSPVIFCIIIIFFLLGFLFICSLLGFGASLKSQVKSSTHGVLCKVTKINLMMWIRCFHSCFLLVTHNIFMPVRYDHSLTHKTRRFPQGVAKSKVAKELFPTLTPNVVGSYSLLQLLRRLGSVVM